MTERYLKHKPSGQMYIYQSAFAANPDFEEVADLKGTPLPAAIDGDYAVVEEPAAPKKTRAKKAVGLAEPTDDDLMDLDAALSADASKGL